MPKKTNCLYSQVADALIAQINGHMYGKLLPSERALCEQYQVSRTTIRQAAKHIGLSKSTVHKHLAERLPAANHALYAAVREILDENKAERHIRGGLATRKKYKGY